MKKYKETIIIGTILISLSVLLHGAHYLIFRDLHHLLIFLVADIAFIPLEVFFVSVVIDRLIEKRESKKHDKKRNMIIGTFFSGIGNFLLSEFVKNSDTIVDKERYIIKKSWRRPEYKSLEKLISNANPSVEIEKIDLLKLLTKLDGSLQYIMGMVTNTTLMEHESFSDLLISVLHLHEELKTREIMIKTKTLREFDYEHLSVDISRVYNCIRIEWTRYMEHLQLEYQFLFATAMINNPYDDRNKEEIEKEIFDL